MYGAGKRLVIRYIILNLVHHLIIYALLKNGFLQKRGPPDNRSSRIRYPAEGGIIQ
jgi:hypothetical protein